MRVTKALLALVCVISMWIVAWRDGRIHGEMGVGYWQGWQDAMLQTDYGKKPYNSEDSLLK